MSYYEVYCDGVSIYDPAQAPLSFLSPVTVSALNEAGNFTFTMPVNHIYYNFVRPYGSTIEVFEDGKSIFYGRPLPPKTDFYKNKQFHCEGAASFLNDVVLPPVPINNGKAILMSQYIAILLNYYNNAIVRNDRKILIGNIHLRYDQSARHVWSYGKCFDELKNNVIPYTGSYFMTRRENGNTYLDCVYEFRDEINQAIVLGENLLDLTTTGNEFCTACIARGGKDASGNDVLMYSPVTLGSDAIQQYGYICTYKEFPACTTLAELVQECMDFLEAQQFNGSTFKLSAADLHLQNSTYQQLLLGKVVKIVSPFHNFQNGFEAAISRVEVALDTGEKRATVATLTAEKLLVPNNNAYSYSGIASIVSADIDKIGQIEPIVINPIDMPNFELDDIDLDIIVGPDGNEYILEIDDTTGEVVPVIIPHEIVTVDEDTGIPIDTINVSPGDTVTIDNGILRITPADETQPIQEISIDSIFGDGTVEPISSPDYNLPDDYTFAGDGTDPTSLVATFNRNGVDYTTSVPINTEKVPHTLENLTGIEFTTLGRTSYVIGSALDTSGFVVSAVYSDGWKEDITSSILFSPGNGYVFVQEEPGVLNAVWNIYSTTGEIVATYTATTSLSISRLSTDPIQQPIPCSSVASASWESDQGGGSSTYYLTGGSGMITNYYSGEDNIIHIAASSSPGVTYHFQHSGDSTQHGTMGLGATYTYNGKTVYYCTDYIGRYGSRHNITGSPMCNGGEIVSGGVPTGAVAWVMIYG